MTKTQCCRKSDGSMASSGTGYCRERCRGHMIPADTWEEIETMLQKYAEEHAVQAETEETG